MGNDVDDCLGLSMVSCIHRVSQRASGLLLPSFSGPHTWLGLDSCGQIAFGVIGNKGLWLRNTL